MKKIWVLVLILVLASVLRISRLDRLPNGLHWDEQDSGYQALSLFKTGKDYYANPLPLFPHSVADYRTPVFIYSAVPSVASLGLSAFSVRLPSVVWSLAGILGIYLLGSILLKNTQVGLLAALTLSVSPWHVQYSRQSVETISLATLLTVGVVLFLRGLSRPRYLLLSALFLALSTAAYSPGKLFVPLFLGAVILIYHRQLISRVTKKTLLISSAVFFIIFLPVLIDGLIGNSGMRFRELSIFTDPTTAATVGYRREELQVASGVPKIVGMSPRLIDKIIYNKLTLWGTGIIQNYLSTFSTDYLFISGDRELRHSPAKDSYGMLHIPDVIPLILGLVHSPPVMTFWTLLAPVPASLTRWDNPHAARLLLLLPALSILIAQGQLYILKKSKVFFSLYLASLGLSGIFTFTYFFNNYSFESAAPFQYGFSQAISEAMSRSGSYDRVVVDFDKDSPLMAYLFTSRLDPNELQALQPLKATDLIPGVPAQKFSNLYLLLPGHRAWEDIKLTGKNLLVIHAGQPSVPKLDSPLKTIFYPDSTPAFYLFNF